MVFSSIPAYLDPANWQQPSNHQTGNSTANHPQLHLQHSPQQPVPPPPPVHPHGGGGPGSASIRPGSMAERARLANIPMPEVPQKCPRCESSNTKFCYFNNYSLTQPRHFCKTCRRYWTRGGALRSVPVGGGCRRNKRTKSTNPKSPVSSSDRQTTSSSTSNVSSNSTTTGQANNIFGLNPSLIHPLKFLSPLSQLSDHHYSTTGDMNLNIHSGISAPTVATNDTNFHMVPNLLGCGIGSGSIEQWRLQQQAQQFSLFGGLESTLGAGLYGQFQANIEPSGFVGETSHQVRPKPPSTSMMLTQLASVKMEENQDVNLSRQIMGIPGNDQWSSAAAAAWTDLTSFSSSSTSNP